MKTVILAPQIQENQVWHNSLFTSTAQFGVVNAHGKKAFICSDSYVANRSDRHNYNVMDFDGLSTQDYSYRMLDITLTKFIEYLINHKFTVVQFSNGRELAKWMLEP